MVYQVYLLERLIGIYRNRLIEERQGGLLMKYGRVCKRIVKGIIIAICMLFVVSLPVYASESEVSDNSIIEEGDGNLVQTAVDVVFGQEYNKSWNRQTYRLNHYNKIVVSQRGFIKIRATKPFDEQSVYGRLEFKLFDENDRVVWSNSSKDAKDDSKTYYECYVGLKPGTYILTLKPGFSVSSGTIDTSYNIGFIPDETCEIEPNESLASATEIDVNSKSLYTGYFGRDWSDVGREDNWKVYLEKGKRYRFYIRYNDLNSTTTIINIFDPNGKYARDENDLRLTGSIEQLVDEDGNNYCDYCAPVSGYYSINIGNYDGKQIKYQLAVKPAVDPNGANQKDPEQVNAFVERMYMNVLKRSSDAKGRGDWSDQLLSGKSCGSTLAQGFICSQEFINQNVSNEEYVDTLYHTFFDRNPDDGGKSNWLKALSEGSTRTQVLAGFVNSQEFANLCDKFGIARGTMMDDGSTLYNEGVRNFVLRNYTETLGRAGETSGVEDWSARINRGEMTMRDVAVSFLNSQEFLNKNLNNEEYVKVLYRTFLGRECDAAGLADWKGQLDRGEKTRDEIVNGFADSQEFANIMAKYK